LDQLSEKERRKYFRSRGVRMKLLLSFILLIAITSGLMVGIAFDTTRRLAVAGALDKMQTLASVFSLEIESDIRFAREELEDAAVDMSGTEMNARLIRMYVDRKLLNSVSVDAVYVFRADGEMLCRRDMQTSAANARDSLMREKEIINAMAVNQPVVFLSSSKYKNPGAIFIAVPIEGRGGAEGVIVAEMTIDSSVMEKAVRDYTVGGQYMDIFLTDEKGTVIAHTDKEMVSKSLFDQGMPLEGSTLEKDYASPLREEVKKFTFLSREEKYLGLAAPIGGITGWRVMLMEPYNIAYAPVRTVVLRILVIGLLALVVGIFIALYRANRVIKPIGELLVAVDDISRGNYSRDVKVYKRDEIGSLAIAFNQMKTSLKDNFEQARKYQVDLEEAYNQLQNDARKREEANRELSRKVRELTSLSEVTQAITTTLDINEVLNTIIDAISRVMGFQICSIKLIDKKTNRLKVEVHRGLGEEYLEKGDTPVGEGISGLAVKMCKPIVIEDTKKDSRLPADHVLHKIGISSIISIPLITKRSVVGAINLYTKNPHKFNEDEKRLLGIFASQAAGAIENARLFESLRESYLNTIQALSMAIDAKDQYTHGHSKRVKDLSSIIGRQMGLTEDQLELLEYAADLHDIGKIGISELIISKEGKLTVEEYDLIKTHPLVGETIIEPVPFLQEVKPIIRHHHERWDGYGYPDGLKGEEIPQMSRIILIADAYDAMTSDRPYRKALTHDEAVREIKKHTNAQFDPEVVEAFLQVFSGNDPESVFAKKGFGG